MMTTVFFLRVPLFALLIVASCGAPFKGSKDQSSSGSNAAANFGSYSRRPVASAPYGGASVSVLPVAPAVSQHALVMAPSFVSSGSLVQPQVAVPAPSLSQAAVQVVPTFGGSGSFVPGQLGVQTSGVQLVQAGPGYGSAVPAAAYPAAPLTYVPVAVGYDAGSSQLGAPQDGMEDTAWAVAPQDLSGLDASGNTQSLNLRDVLPSPPQPETAPGLQSGETSSVVKEAELGNYQQQTEEFSYPDDRQVSGPRSPTVLVPQYGVRGSLFPNFDYRLLYGQYPPGTYSTFSQQNEKGKDYSQEIHYLKEHVSDDQGSGQQKKLFPGSN
ncbi:uncharacterized protein ACNS7B_012787 [Menidia menidia]